MNKNDLLQQQNNLVAEAAKLKNQLADVQANLDKIKLKEQEDRFNSIEENIDVFLKIIPEHEHHSCNDAKPTNLGGCLRCTLLATKKNNYWDISYDIEINLVKNNRY